jgi:glucose/arabinose dehydrogenase
MAFLPGSGVPLTNAALVTEKPGRLWLVDGTGAKQQVAGARAWSCRARADCSTGRGPDLAGDQTTYLTYSEPSANGGSGLALARAKLTGIGANPRLDGLTVLWRDPGGGDGGHLAGALPSPPTDTAVPEFGRPAAVHPAQDPSQPLGKILL